MTPADGQAARRLLARPRFGAGLGLHRMWTLSRPMAGARWMRDVRALHVVGTKGKGTVATLADALLRALGYRTGLFVSPHLLRFEERIVIDGTPIKAPALERAVAAVERAERSHSAVHPEDGLGAFEAITLAAFEAFAEADVDVAILEAGIGGRYDATRVAGGALAALTSIGTDHAALLGPTAAHILYDKADICPTGGTLVAGRLDPDLDRRLRAFAALKGCHLALSTEAVTIDALRHEAAGVSAAICLEGVSLGRLETRLYGAHQMENAALAILLVARWLARDGDTLDRTRFAAAARSALARTVLPLRFETIAQDPITIGDIAHTGPAARALRETLDAVFPARPVVLILGVGAEKNAAAILRGLAPATRLICTTPRHRGLAGETLAALARSIGFPAIAVSASSGDAYREARAAARAMGAILVATGSSVLAAEVKTLAAGGDPAALHFL